MYIVVGLGNPGEKYALTRHNTGRMLAEFVSQLKNTKAKFIFPDTFMNKSGSAIAKVVKSKGAAKKLIVIYDDLDLPLGKIKISYDRSSGGHRGLESIIRALKTREFIRIRIGISPRKKPSGPEAVEKFILGNFKTPERQVLKKISKKVSEIVKTITDSGLEIAMNEFN